MYLYILAALFVLYAIYILITYIYGRNYINKTLQSEITDSTERDILRPSSMPLTPYGQGVRWSFSLWIYVQDMNIRYGRRKHIFTRQLPSSDEPHIDLYIDERTPTLKLQYLDTSGISTPKTVTLGTLSLKKWQQIVIIQENEIIDIFVDGKVVFSSSGDLPVLSVKGEEVILSKNGGWNGYRAKVLYSNYNKSLQEIRSELSDGPLTMSWMNPIYYLYLLGGYINEANNYILSLTLKDPDEEAQKALQDKQKKKKEEEEKNSSLVCADGSTPKSS